MLVAIVLEISFYEISLESREVIIPDFCIDESGWIVCVCLEFVKVLCICCCIILEVYHTMPDLCLCVGVSIVGEKLSLCIIDVLLLFKVYVRIDTWEDEVIVVYDRKWDISDEDCSDKFTRSVLFAIKINVFQELYNIFGFERLGIDRENGCFGIGYTSLDIVTSISLDIVGKGIVDIFIDKDRNDVGMLGSTLCTQSANNKIVYNIWKYINKADENYRKSLQSRHARIAVQ